MPRTRLIITGIAVAAAAVTGSAFTAANTLSPPDNVAGYGSATVTGTTVNNIAYTPDADPSLLASVVFTATTEVPATADAIMSFTNSGSAVSGSASTCVVGTWDAGTSLQPITCTLTAALAFASFDSIGLTVVSQ